MIARRVLVIAVALAGAVCTLGVTTELVRNDFVEGQVSANYVTVSLAAVLVGLAIGTVLVLRRPDSISGWLLVLGAAAAGAAFWRFSSRPILSTLAMTVTFATALLPFHAAIAYGAGEGRAMRRAMIAGQALLAAVGIAIVLTADAGVLDRWFVADDWFAVGNPAAHVENRFLVSDRPGFARGAHVAWWVGLLTLGWIAAAVRVVRWRKEPELTRRRTTPLMVGLITWMAAMTAAAATLGVDRTYGARGNIADFGAVMLPMFALGLVAATLGWVDLVHPRLARSARGEVDLHDLTTTGRRGLRAALADVLATPNVDVVFARDDGWVDTDGHPRALTDDRRRATVVRRDGHPIAAVLHDADVPGEAVELGARLVAAQLEAERATALARARAEAVRASAAELVRAGDRAAAALETQLLLGPLPALGSLAEDLECDPGAIGHASASLREITGELRQLSHGLLPRELEEHGLSGVLGARGAVARRLPAAVEVTVYLLAHDDATATIVDAGDHILVTRTLPVAIEAGERTAVLGGRVDGTVAVVPLA